MKASHFVSTGALALLALIVVNCSIDQAPAGLRAAPPGTGPQIVFDLQRQPLPEIPQPNDVATFADPTSRTGRRINVSVAAPTALETAARHGFGEMEGWGTFAPITLSVTRDPATPATQAAIDLNNVRSRMQNDGHDFTNDPVYVINLTTGVPVMLDMGDGNFPISPRDLNLYWPNDPKINEENICFESVEEGAGLSQAQYSPNLDLDFDGVLDHPDTLPAMGGIPGVDDLLTWYERESDTLILQPLLPMEEKTEYAVIVTDRLTAPDGQPVRSPFTYINHPAQTQDLAPLGAILADSSRKNYYGDIAGTGWGHVQFAWSFTTQPVYEDLRLLRDGLYGKGPFAHLASEYPVKAEAIRAVGLQTSAAAETTSLASQPQCVPVMNAPYVVNLNLPATQSTLDLILQVTLQSQFSLTPSQLLALQNSLDSVDHFVIGTFVSPYFVGTDPKHENPDEWFQLDYKTGRGRVTGDTVPFFLAIPKAKPGASQPFPTVLWTHGTSLFSEEAIVRVGYFARQGLATMAIDMPGHGLNISAADQEVAQIALTSSCYVEWLNGLLASRAYDLNGDGVPDSGGYLWTSHIFHSRDNIRQSVVDQMQTARLVRSFDGKTMSDQDYNGDGKPDLAGDFDGNGVPDIGETTPLYTAGDSYGGIVAMIHGAVDPYVSAAAPISGGGGLINLAVHSSLVPTPVLEQIFSPLVIAVPASSRDSTADLPSACSGSQLSLRFEVNDLFNSRELEIACLDPADIDSTTMMVINWRNQVTHCARAGTDGTLRLPISANVGDPIQVQFFKEADAVESYKTCQLKPGAASTAGKLINTWQVPAQTFTATANQTACTAAGGCQQFRETYYPVGSQLVAPQEGLGYARQTPDARRLFTITQAALDPSDPINFAPYYMFKTIPGLNGEALPHRGILVQNTMGDPYVPTASGSDFARAAGVLPFLPPQAVTSMPEYADYASPQPIVDALGGLTPNDFLLQNHVIRGLARLEETQAGPNCGVNALTSPPAALMCGAPPAIDPTQCAQTLYDADWSSEGTNLYDAPHPSTPLRLGRLTSVRATDAASLLASWAPRISVLPANSPDGNAGTVPLVGLVNAYVNPVGQHVFFVNDPCRNFDDVTYYDTMMARFLATGGTDIYALSHPQTHKCMASETCPFDD